MTAMDSGDVAADTRLHAKPALTSWRIGWGQTMQPRTTLRQGPGNR